MSAATVHSQAMTCPLELGSSWTGHQTKSKGRASFDLGKRRDVEFQVCWFSENNPQDTPAKGIFSLFLGIWQESIYLLLIFFSIFTEVWIKDVKHLVIIFPGWWEKLCVSVYVWGLIRNIFPHCPLPHF
jgi:hypothetical protein